ncbi:MULTISPECIES: hypothetical protein [Delftia]|jgi:hypothetical protein|uniref:hypothetical protein n=1 Tax=Delftia TaxID=80865 RepID=UPI000A40D6D6|nr:MULTISPECIES: hypothetical protein [Delftia]MDH2234084.1 hypothetical protein [Delftia tsuruhatensis]
MSTQQPTSTAFIAQMQQHSEEMRCLARAFDEATEAFGASNLAAAVTEEKVEG